MTNRQRAIFMAWIIPMIFLLVIPFATNDLAGWIALGRYFLDHHEILRNDIFSVLPTEPLVYPSWGVSVIYAWIYQWGGLKSVCLLHLIVLIAILHLVYSCSISNLKNPTNRIARWSTYVFWIVGVALFEARPNMVALVPLIIGYNLISRIKTPSDLRPKLVLQLCLTNIFWVNIHGSFILLEAMLVWKTFFLFIDSVTDRSNSEPKNKALYLLWIRSALSVAIVSLTSLINPFTYRVFPYIFETVQKSKDRFISEWIPTTPWMTFPIGFLYFVLLAALVILLIKRSKKNDFWRFFSSPFFPIVFTGLGAIRNAALPFILLLPALKEAGFLDSRDKISGDSDLPKLSNIFKVAPFLLLFVLSFPEFKNKALFFLPLDIKTTFDDSVLFHTANKIRATGRTCPIFNDWKVGSFLMLKLPNKIYLDFRNIIYSDQDFKTYVEALAARPHWEEFLDQYHACFAIVDKEFSPDLVTALNNNKSWRPMGEENGYAAYERLY
jgi:hypothetical protein